MEGITYMLQLNEVMLFIQFRDYHEYLVTIILGEVLNVALVEYDLHFFLGKVVHYVSRLIHDIRHIIDLYIKLKSNWE